MKRLTVQGNPGRHDAATYWLVDTSFIQWRRVRGAVADAMRRGIVRCCSGTIL
jgi:hypothetical protein